MKTAHPSTWRGAVSVICAAAIQLVCADAQAFCVWSGPGWPSIPVRLHPDLHNQMFHSDGTAWTRSELEQTVRIVIARLNDSAGANIPPVFLDPTPGPNCAWLDNNCTDGVTNPNVNSTCEIPNAIHVVPSNCILNSIDIGATGQGRVIHLQRTNSGVGPKPWDQYAGPGEVLQHTLLHELGHGLGLGHPQDCAGFSTMCPPGATHCSVMAGMPAGTRAEDYFMPDDRDGLRAVYGSPPAPTRRQFESNNLSLGFTEFGVGAVDGQGFFAVSSEARPTASTLTIGGYRRDVAGAPTAFSWNWSTFAMTPLGAPSGHFANGPVAAAQNSNFEIVTTSSYRASGDARRWRRRLAMSVHSLGDPTPSWITVFSNPAPGSIEDTVSAGVSTAWNEPAAQLMIALRADDGRILLKAGVNGVPFATNIQSEGSPSISCVPTSGSNCILVSVEPGRPITTSRSPRLRWTKFSWSSSGGFAMGPLQTETHVIHDGDPQVAAYRVAFSETFEFVVTYRETTATGTTHRALRMNASAGTSFSSVGTVATTAQRTFVATGSTHDLETFMFTR